MEIKSIPEIIKEMDSLVLEEKYEDALLFGKENISLEKEYVDGEYVFKNLLEELLFQITIKKEIKRKYPLILDYSTLYSNYGNVLLHFNQYENALKSFELSQSYNPINVNAIFGLCEIHEQNENWDDYYKLSIQSFKYDYTRDDLAKSFGNLSRYYLNEFKVSNDLEDLKLAVFLNKLGSHYYGLDDFREMAGDLGDFKEMTSLSDFKEIASDLNIPDADISDYAEKYENNGIDEVRDYLKSKGLPYAPSVEVITICKNLGFQLDESKKVVPALFYFNIVYDLTEDPSIQDIIDDLNEKVDRRLNE